MFQRPKVLASFEVDSTTCHGHLLNSLGHSGVDLPLLLPVFSRPTLEASQFGQVLETTFGKSGKGDKRIGETFLEAAQVSAELAGDPRLRASIGPKHNVSIEELILFLFQPLPVIVNVDYGLVDFVG